MTEKEMALIDKLLGYFVECSRRNFEEVVKTRLKPRTNDTIIVDMVGGETFIFCYRTPTRWILSTENMLK